MQYRRLIIVLLLVFLVLFGWLSLKDTVNKKSQSTEVLDFPTLTNDNMQYEEPVQEITISAIGDILIHDRVYDDAETGNGYDFMPMLEQVKSKLNDTTITFANQETMIGGTEIGLSSYPTFNSPVEVGDALKEVGVDIVSLANNHTLDRGEVAIQQAIQHWEEIDMLYVGAYKDFDDQEKRRIMETDEGIAVGFLAYTYGTNGIPIPDGRDYLVHLIDQDRMKEEIQEIKEHADATIVSLHFGDEYERMPNEEQKALAQLAADEGADVILGHHPHVLQPMEWLEGKHGNKTLVIYSLGNFLSGQDKLYRQIGGILTFSIKKDVTGEQTEISVHSPEFLLTYNASEDETNYRVLPLHQVTDDLLPDAKTHYTEMKTHMSQWMPELEFIEVAE